MKILGTGSLASRLRLLLDVVLVLWLIVGALNAFLLLSLIIEPTHPLRQLLNVTTIYAVPAGACAPTELLKCSDPGVLLETRLLAYANYRPGGRGFILAIAVATFVLWGLNLVVIRQLKQVFASLTSELPFLRSNVPRIRTIGWALIAACLFHHAWDWGAMTHMRSTLTLAGQVPNVPTDFIIDWIHPEMLFVGAAVLVLAEIFRLGASLQEEQTLTI
jgi:hypothetical protein